MNKLKPRKKISSNFIQIGQKQIEVNHKGFLINFNDWNKEIAIVLAKSDQLELTDVHWFMINYLRNYYQEYQIHPSIKKFKKKISKKINSLGNKQTLRQYFPLGGYKHACRLAGLPEYYGYSC